MSQHRYSTSRNGREVHVLAGWDRPLQYVFLNIESLPPEPGNLENLSETEKEAYYGSLDAPECTLFNNLLTPLRDVVHIGEVLKSLDLPIPQGFLEGIAEDQAQNVGNKVVEYQV